MTAAGQEGPSPERGEPLVTARAVIEWRRSLGQALPKPAASLLLTHQPSLLPRRPWYGRRRLGRGPYTLANLTGDVDIALCPGVGGPGTAVAIEELAVLGVRKIIGIDVAGSLDAALASGDVLLVSGALPEDGVSRHYTRSALVRPSAVIEKALRDALETESLHYREGTVWSTDAVYKETPAAVRANRTKGAVAVDMESAALLAAARATGIEAASLLVIADVLGESWRPPADWRSVERRLRTLVRVAIAALHR